MTKQTYKVSLYESVTADIQQAVDYYNSKQKGLGIRFYKVAKKTLNSLKTDAHLYQIKYKNIRCIKINKFPYLLHYEMLENQKTVKVYALICSFKNLDTNWVK